MVAKFLALLNYRLSVKDKEAVKYNLSAIIKDESRIEGCAREVFVNFAYYLVDFFRFSRINHDFIKKYVKVSGLEHLQWAYSQKMPIIALTAHLGNYELAGAVTSLLGYPVAAVALPHKDQRTNNFFNSNRHRVGMKVIATGSRVKGCLSALKDNFVLALLADRDFSHSGIKMELFSRFASLPRGIAFFSKKSGACIIPGFLVRVDKYNYHLSFEEPMCLARKENIPEEEIMRRYIPVLEKYISNYPEQWYMFEKYWIPENSQ